MTTTTQNTARLIAALPLTMYTANGHALAWEQHPDGRVAVTVTDDRGDYTYNDVANMHPASVLEFERDLRMVLGLSMFDDLPTWQKVARIKLRMLALMRECDVPPMRV